jgi:hypothetical protein
VRVVEGGSIALTNPGEWSVQMSAPAGRETTLTLAYSFPIPLFDTQAEPDRAAVAIPLVWLEPCPRCETTVRIWSGVTPAGLLVPVLDSGPWTEIPPRAVPDRPTLPAVSLHGSGTHLPLNLRLTTSDSGPGTGLVVERVWIQAVVDTDGQQAYRTRCLIRPQQTHYLDVELPAPPAAIRFAALLDGKGLPWTTGEGPGGRFVRLRLDAADIAPGPQHLDLVQLLPPRPGFRWEVMLTPPRLRGPVFIGPVRWQISLASGDLLVGRDGSTEFEWRWGWQRGLFVPQPAWSTADLQRWFGPDSRSAIDAGDRLEATLVGWQPALEPASFFVVPGSWALLVGSISVLGLGLAAVRVAPRWRVAGAVVLAIALVWLAGVRPEVLALVSFAAEPGLAVLGVVLVARWFAQRRYRRRVLFLPGFARPTVDPVRVHRGTAATGSSLVRNGAGMSRVRREPSTIDAPAAEPGLPAGER